MPSINPESFKKSWPRCFVIFLGIVEVVAAIVLIITELGNVGANFWTTNVFAGGWCGLIMIIHFFGLFVAGCCAPGPPAAFRAVVITVIALLACGALIGFDAYFIAQPTACILTSSCSSNAASTTVFSYSFRTSFFTAFNSLSAFKSYSESQTKYLFQTIQLSIGCLCFVLCIIYMVIYYVTRNKSLGNVAPHENPRTSNFQQQQQQQQRGAQQQQQGQTQWNANRRY
ncbi:unnamed protein product [Rotaria sp. Silwood1]|nr:unnamed protein product [Rotaria sp. Silwood1]CAF1506196.1 unnamed protein product [Rotaria sp. Silwood1]CAF3675748.1 unnamed protein product [Rotaria sp. Silwood1]CAF4650276.1 unnamed protein product [Rotaria sp. Silwood1]CAF4658533.1 unnamed protein product [Rotaria sp. Silwood1]